MRWTRRFPRGLLRARMVAGYGSTLPQQEASPLAQRRNGRGLASATRVGHRVGLETTGPGVLRQRLTRRAVLHVRARRPPVRLGLAAWGRTQAWARRGREQGHAVRRFATTLPDAARGAAARMTRPLRPASPPPAR